MRTKVDLSQLAVLRDVPAPLPVASVARRRGLLTRFVLPVLLLAGFAILVVYAARETLSPPRAVTVIPVTTAQSAMDAPPDTPLFRAAGWVEPRPTPLIVTALAEGVVERLLVVEGQEVKEGQTLARLISADAKFALESAEAEVELRESDLAASNARLTAARARHEVPVHLQAELADAETALAKVESEAASLPILLKGARSRQSAARRDWDYRQKASDVVSEASLSKSKGDLGAADAIVEELQSRQKRLPLEIASSKAKRDAQKQKLDRKVDEIRQLGEDEAAVKASQARLRQSRAARDSAKLRLDRMSILSPAHGRVLGLIARPGMRLSGMTGSSLQESSTVATMYDPARLQVRVDVRLDDVGKVRAGQTVRIESAALPERQLGGEVLLATSQADIQKNTLSVKVAIHDPPTDLKPEMLCQVTFLSPPRPASSAAGKGDPYRMLVPKQLIDNSGGSPGIWVADQLRGTAHFRPVEVGLSSGDLVEISSGLASQDKLIVAGREGLREGIRVRVLGEDDSLGIVQQTTDRKKK